MTQTELPVDDTVSRAEALRAILVNKLNEAVAQHRGSLPATPHTLTRKQWAELHRPILWARNPLQRHSPDCVRLRAVEGKPMLDIVRELDTRFAEHVGFGPFGSGRIGEIADMRHEAHIAMSIKRGRFVTATVMADYPTRFWQHSTLNWVLRYLDRIQWASLLLGRQATAEETDQLEAYALRAWPMSPRNKRHPLQDVGAFYEGWSVKDVSSIIHTCRAA
jgi:hypothetical protein